MFLDRDVTEGEASMRPVQAVRCVEIGVGNLDATSRFYGGIWGLEEVARCEGARFFRGTCSYHHILTLVSAPRPCLARIILDAYDREAVDRLHRELRSAKVGLVEEPARLARPGGGYGFGFTDPEGRNLAVVSDVSDHSDSTSEADRPIKIGHVNLNSSRASSTLPFYLELLGFRLSDETELF